MKRLVLVLCSLFFVFGVLKARAQSSKIVGYGALYGTYINYKGSDVKKYGYSYTGYLSLWKGRVNNLQLGVEDTYIESKKGYSDINQIDFTLLYSNVNGILKNHAFTFGVHYIKSDDDLTDNGYTFFFDGTYLNYQTKYPYLFNWSAGVGVFYSDYSNLVDFYVFQLTPHTSFRIYSSLTFGGLYADVVGYYIYLNNSDKVGVNESNYYSLDVALRYYYGRYEFKIGGWAGKQVFAVKKGGFVVYNLSEKYKGGVYIETAYNFSKHFRGSLNLSYNKYTEVSTGDNVDQIVGTVSIGYRF